MPLQAYRFLRITSLTRINSQTGELEQNESEDLQKSLIKTRPHGRDELVDPAPVMHYTVLPDGGFKPVNALLSVPASQMPNAHKMQSVS